MAKTNLAYLTFPITKRTQQPDGSVIIEGPVTDDSLDLDGQIVDAASAAKSLQDWFDEYANVRQQHSPILAPAGKGIALTFKNGVPWLKAKIVEPTAIKLVLAKIYQAFSIGIADGQLDTSPAARKRAPNGILYPTLTNEVSITDYPANVGMGKFSFAKRKNGSLYVTERVMDIDKNLRDLDGDSLVTALKGLHAGATAKVGAIVHTAKSPKAAAKLIGTQFDPDEYEAQGSVIVMKRNFDAGVGGGVDRDQIPAKDFADKKNRKFPIVTPKDVHDAAGLHGHSDNPEKIKSRIIAIAQRKGPKFVAKLPKEWRNEMGTSQKSKKAAGTEDGKPFPGAAKPFTSKDDDTDDKSMDGMDDEKKSKKAKKGKIPPVDQKVTDDLEKADDAVSDAKENQAVDNEHHESGDDADDQDTKSKKGSKKKLKKAAQRMAKEARKAKAAAAQETAMTMKRAHDVLCPLYKKSVTKSLDKVTDVIDPNFFRERLNLTPEDAIETFASRKSAYLAASDIATLKVPELNALRSIAHKSFMDAYPNLKVASPDLSDPSSFQRGFLPSATKETADSISKPGNFVDAKPLAPEQFQRGPLTVNEARPSLVGGTSMAMKSRQFYTNAAKDSNADAMATLHDHIAENYPSICPGLGDESGDRLGTPAEMYSPHSPTTSVDTKGNASVQPVASADLVSATKRAMEEELKPFIKKAQKREKKQAKEIKRLKKSLAQPDYTKSAKRHTEFAPTHAPVVDITEGKRERIASAKRIAERIHDSHSGASYDDMKELQELGIPATQFADLMVDDN